MAYVALYGPLATWLAYMTSPSRNKPHALNILLIFLPSSIHPSGAALSSVASKVHGYGGRSDHAQG